MTTVSSNYKQFDKSCAAPTPIPPERIPPQEKPPEIIPPEQIPPVTMPPQVIPPDRIPPDSDLPDTLPQVGHHLAERTSSASFRGFGLRHSEFSI